MTVATCRRCGNPIADMYSKSPYCTSCSFKKERLHNLDIFFRVFGIFVTIPIIISLVLGLLRINSSLTLYAYLIVQSSFVVVSIIGIYFVRSSMKKFDTSK